jgi:LCCL domain
VVLVAAYIISFAFFSRAQSFITPAQSFIGCTSTYWLANNGCGQDGQDCDPFDNSSFDFRCPAQCENVILQNPRTVGNEQIAFKPLLVGGGDDNGTYRGDTFICAAAIQA